jgi:hypothetical protein
LPAEVLARATEILQGLEEGETDATGKPARIKPKGVARGNEEKGQMDLFGCGSAKKGKKAKL